MRRERIILRNFQSVELCYLYHNQKLCLHQLSSLSIKKLSKINVGSRHGDNVFNIILGIVTSDLLMNLLYCHGFLKNINSVVILKFPKRTLEYYFSKVFPIFECNIDNLEKNSERSKTNNSCRRKR